MTKKDSPIGVFDSGVGGISVLKELVKILPGEDFIYYGDSINAPYGIRPKEEVKELTIKRVGELLDMGAKAICVACNTATSAAVAAMRLMYPDLPLVGIEPAIKPAAESGNHPTILVMATPMTIQEEKFQNLLNRFKDQADILKLPCPGLMDFVEQGILEGQQLDDFLNELLKEYIERPLDGVVLGCTHYPFLKVPIQKALGGKVRIFDGSEGTARELKRRLTISGLLKEPSESKGSVKFINSDPKHLPLANRLFLA